MTPYRLCLTPREFAEAFPFHFALDRSWRVTQHGRNLPRVAPRMVPGRLATEAFRMLRPEVPFTWDGVAKHSKELFLLACLGSEVCLRGQMVPVEDGETLLFLGSPWFTSAEALLAAGLGLEDFAIHDPGTDMLLVMQAQQAAVGELKELAGRLTLQRADLREANARLEQRNQELQAAQEALARSEAEARLLGLVAARTDNGVVITDAEGRVVWVNEGFARITGFGIEELQGRTPGSVLQGEGTDAATVAYMRDRIRGRLGFRTEVLNYSKDGRECWVSLEVQPVRDAQGVLTHFLAIQSDITDRRRAEEALRGEKELLGTTLASIVDGVIAVDAQRHVRLLNPAAEMLTGWAIKAAQGQPLSSVFDLRTPDGGQAPEFIQQAFELRAAIGDIHETEPNWVLRSRDGRLRRVVVSVHPMLRDQGRIVGGLVAFRDVSTELDADDMKRDFVSAVSHELRTPLTSIRGFLTTLLNDPDMPEATRREFLQIVSDQSQRLAHLVEDILEVSRMESGQVRFEMEPINLVEMVRRSLDEILPLTLRKDLRLDVRVDPALPVLMGDPDRVRSIFSNLLSNAVKFTPAQGTVGLEVHEKDSGLHITVSDTGPGIPPELQHRIFEKFYRIRRAGFEAPGTGLGLSIVRSVVERMGGTIEVRSVPNQGTCFIVVLPLTGAPGT